MTIHERRLLGILVASLLIVAGGMYLGATLKIVLSGDLFPATQLALMGVGGTLALIGGVLLLRRATRIEGVPVIDGHANTDQPREINSTGV